MDKIQLMTHVNVIPGLYWSRLQTFLAYIRPYNFFCMLRNSRYVIRFLALLLLSYQFELYLFSNE